MIVCNISAEETDALQIRGEMIYVTASFEQVDYFSTLSQQGEFQWELPFKTKIISWKKQENHLFILSKMRDESAFFLSCVDAANGTLQWEKGIYAPSKATGE